MAFKKNQAFARNFVIPVLTIACLFIFCPKVYADTPIVPSLISFTMSPDTVDIAAQNSTVSFDLVVSSANGIASTQTLITLTDGFNLSTAFPIKRTDSPIDYSRTTVEFKGSYNLAGSLSAGVYKATSSPIIGRTSTGADGYPTQKFSATTSSKIFGAYNSLLVRAAGNLNYNFATFVGPSFNISRGTIFVDPKYNSMPAPIWRVGETFLPRDYYELEVPSLKLKVKTTTPSTCLSGGVSVQFVAPGNCEFIVFTDQTPDYQYRQDIVDVTVGPSRLKPTLIVNPLASQSSSSLPQLIPGPVVYGPFGLVVPASSTPSVCNAAGSYISITSGGICTLLYSTPGSSDYLPADPVPLSFEVTRSPQSISFKLPPKLDLGTKVFSLSASASSGLPVTFQSSSPSTCEVTENSLTLLHSGVCELMALQGGSATIAPSSLLQKTLVEAPRPFRSFLSACIRKEKRIASVGGKCPTGYKLSR